MADINMIPRSYREGVRVRRTLTAYGAALALLVVVGGGSAAVLRWRLAVETPRLDQARASSTQVAALRAQLDLAQQRKDALLGDVGALAAIRGTGEVAALASVLEQARDDDVWFGRLRFSRTREQLPALPDAPAPDIVVARVPAPAGAPDTQQAWRLGSHVEIDGEALDHSAMTSFLGRITADPALTSVRFLNSSAATATESKVVAFGIAASLKKEKRHE
jgi:Tfp pilus assembly protein PilN